MLYLCIVSHLLKKIHYSVSYNHFEAFKKYLAYRRTIAKIDIVFQVQTQL